VATFLGVFLAGTDFLTLVTGVETTGAVFSNPVPVEAGLEPDLKSTNFLISSHVLF
jgi:hypothetical protein